MVSKSRAIRISERIRRELSEILLISVNDPRLNGVSITDVRVDRELAYAEIYVCAIEGVERAEQILSSLERAQGYLRSELAKRVEIRNLPRLRFHWDSTFEQAETIERIIASLHAETIDQESGLEAEQNSNPFNEDDHE